MITMGLKRPGLYPAVQYPVRTPISFDAEQDLVTTLSMRENGGIPIIIGVREAEGGCVRYQIVGYFEETHYPERHCYQYRPGEWSDVKFPDWLRLYWKGGGTTGWAVDSDPAHPDADGDMGMTVEMASGGLVSLDDAVTDETIGLIQGYVYGGGDWNIQLTAIEYCYHPYNSRDPNIPKLPKCGTEKGDAMTGRLGGDGIIWGNFGPIEYFSPWDNEAIGYAEVLAGGTIHLFHSANAGYVGATFTLSQSKEVMIYGTFPSSPWGSTHFYKRRHSGSYTTIYSWELPGPINVEGWDAISIIGVAYVGHIYVWSIMHIC